MNLKRFAELIAGSVFLFSAIIYSVYIGVGIPEFIYYGNFLFFILYFAPKVAPLFAIGVFLIIRKSSKTLDALHKGVVAVAFAVAVAVSVAAVFVDWTQLTWILTEDFDWSVAGWLTWNFAFVLFYIVAKNRLFNSHFGFVYALLGISAGGLLYELPVGYWNYQIYYHATFPLFVNTQWISLSFLLLMLGGKGFKFNKYVCVGIAVYVLGSILYAVFGWNGSLFFNNSLYWQWLPRVATVILILLLPFGIRKEVNV